MNILAIDTHEVVKELKAVGFSEDQAEAVTRVVRRSQDIDLSSLATKVDLDLAVSGLRADIEALRKDSRSDVEALRKDSRSDVEALRKDSRSDVEALRKDMDMLRKDVKADLSEQKADLLKWVVGAIGFQTVVILGAVLALAHALRP